MIQTFYQRKVKQIGKKKRLFHLSLLSIFFGLALVATLSTFTINLDIIKITSSSQSSPASLLNDGSLRSSSPSAAHVPPQQLNQLHDSICSPEMGKDWNHLCSFNFVKTAAGLLLKGDHINIVQIGAHTGFEENDPIAKGISELLDRLVDITSDNELRKRVHWTFVEPSPPNFKRLSENLSKYSDVCDMNGINAAVVSDHAANESKTDDMIFYSIRDTIDPETGFDSISGKTLPLWITQLSSFSKDPILYNRHKFKSLNLSAEDYIVEVKVTVKRYSDLMKEAVVTENRQQEHIEQPPLLVLIDTEGFDCDIVQGIAPSSLYLPEYLLFEHKQCKKTPAYEHLRGMGYNTRIAEENTVASKTKVIE